MDERTPRLVLLLGADRGPRALELLLDSVVGQTERRILLLADPAALSTEAAALIRRYGDARLRLAAGPVPDGVEAVARLAGDEILAPTYAARMLAALARSGASALRCGATLFDAGKLQPASGVAAPATRVARTVGGLAQPDGAHLPDRLVVTRGAAAPAADGAPGRSTQRRLPMTLFGEHYVPAGIEAERPPTLFVEVDTEAEFDWGGEFRPDLTRVDAIGAVSTAQALFDRYGLRPAYLIDWPVATQAAGIAAIGALAERGAAAIGAHLHPWTNPPRAERLDPRLSYPGNLPEALEAAKLAELTRAIAANFGERPVFYKAGRYGTGPNTPRLIAAQGYRVDFSLIAETDLRPRGGPDFRRVAAIPYAVPAHGLLALPMTRADIGPLSRWWNMRSWVDREAALTLRARGVLARSRLMERLTLTPEGMTAREQIVLLRTLLARGHRSFVLHYHSPSLVPGNTGYVRNEAERREFLSRLDAVLYWFFEELGGLPGRPWDLLPVEQRARRM